MVKNKSAEPDLKNQILDKAGTGEPDPNNLPGGDSEPSDDHPRFKEVYGKWKESERRSGEMQKDLDAVRTHSRTMMGRLEELETKKVDRPSMPMPSVSENPEAWEAWHKTEMTTMKREFADQLQKTASASIVQAIKFSEPKYESMASLAEEEISRGNEQLKNKIWNSDNPYRAAFNWGLEQRGGAGSIDPLNGKSGPELTPKPPGGVEGSGDLPPAAPQRSPKLSEGEERVIRQTFFFGERNVPQEKWAEAVKKYRSHQKVMRIQPGGLGL